MKITIRFNHDKTHWSGAMLNDQGRELLSCKTPVDQSINPRPPAWSAMGDARDAMLKTVWKELSDAADTPPIKTAAEFESAFIKMVKAYVLDYASRYGELMQPENYHHDIWTADFIKKLARRRPDSPRDDEDGLLKEFLVDYWEPMHLGKLLETELAALVNLKFLDKIPHDLKAHIDGLSAENQFYVNQLAFKRHTAITPANIRRICQRLGLFSNRPPGPRGFGVG